MTAIDIAAAVLQRAVTLDHRIQVSPDAVNAWADCFEDKWVWTEEAVRAVSDHYSQPSPFPIMPGDVLDRVAQMDMNAKSSQERIDWTIDFWAERPYVNGLIESTGVEFTLPVEPDEVRQKGSWATHDWHREWLRGWVAENRERLVESIRSGRARYGTPRHEGW